MYIVKSTFYYSKTLTLVQSIKIVIGIGMILSNYEICMKNGKKSNTKISWKANRKLDLGFYCQLSYHSTGE